MSEQQDDIIRKLVEGAQKHVKVPLEPRSEAEALALEALREIDRLWDECGTDEIKGRKGFSE
jgi:hypothetical protein